MLLMVYNYVTDGVKLCLSWITNMLETSLTSLTLFTCQSVAKCVSLNKDYYYLNYRYDPLLGKPSLWTTVE